jgi:hypothetical protein
MDREGVGLRGVRLQFRASPAVEKGSALRRSVRRARARVWEPPRTLW